MNIITLLQLLVDSGAVSPKAPTRPSFFPDRDRSSGKGQGARVDLGLLRHFK
jgi:hypothetical protein